MARKARQMAVQALGLRAGVWQGRLTGARATAPGIEVTHQGQALPGVGLAPDGKDGWLVTVPVPVETLGDGVQTYLVSEAATGLCLGSFMIVSGEPLDGDLHAEVKLLRAELDMLKRAFRRQGSGGG